jgi:excisionase family DNA binding protein
VNEPLSATLPIPDGKPILITADELAAKLALSKRTIYRMLSAGTFIQPLRLGGAVRWRLDEIEAWIAAGCPNRNEWEVINSQEK